MNDMMEALEMRRNRGLDVTVVLDGVEYALIPKEEVSEEKAEGVEGMMAQAPQDEGLKPSGDNSELAPDRPAAMGSLEEELPNRGLAGKAKKFWQKKKG